MCRASCMINHFQLVVLARHLEAMIVIHYFLLLSCCWFSNVLNHYCISFCNYFLPYEQIFHWGGLLSGGERLRTNLLFQPTSLFAQGHGLLLPLQASPYHFWAVYSSIGSKPSEIACGSSALPLSLRDPVIRWRYTN